VSPSLAIPLLRAAYDESRPELQELWAQLIAAAMDPQRANKVRRSFIDTVRRLDPLDALILKELGVAGGGGRRVFDHRTPTDFFTQQLKVSADEIYVSAINLHARGCLTTTNSDDLSLQLTAYGRELVRACCSD
jgi:hypothetical protein